MELNNLNIIEIEVLNDTQFHVVTDKGLILLDINEVTINGIKPNSISDLGYQSLSNYKKSLIDLQDKKTENLILSGFTFDGNLFSLSKNAQINWSNLLNIPSSMFPLNLSTKDDTIYVLNFSDVQNFYFAALSKKNECLQFGNDVKKRINESKNIAELDLIKSEINVSN